MSTANDKVYTPDNVAKDLVSFFKPSGIILEPCKGDGSIFKYLDENAKWCEIDYGIDFFDFNEKVDWIITNPPYSIFDDWLDHSLPLADDIVFLVPVSKILSSYKKMDKIYKWGGLKHIRYYGTGRKMGFPFGFPVAAFHLRKSYKNEMGVSFYKSS